MQLSSASYIVFLHGDDFSMWMRRSRQGVDLNPWSAGAAYICSLQEKRFDGNWPTIRKKQISQNCQPEGAKPVEVFAPWHESAVLRKQEATCLSAFERLAFFRMVEFRDGRSTNTTEIVRGSEIDRIVYTDNFASAQKLCCGP